MKFDERGAPIAHPLKTWDEVMEWKRSDAQLFAGAVPSPAMALPNRRRTLVCHDMAGGYLQDRFTQGCDDVEAYRFYHWQHVDLFVYFSHYFVTLPPPTWINAAHIHGTPILGTIITEWEDGKKLCGKFLESKETCEVFAEKLAQIALTYGFDGWLINIENQIESEKVGQLEEFVALLTQKMHERKRHSYVLWYDSVINTGELAWQNCLNDLNSKFFDGCDGIFLNYTWKDGHLNYSKEIALHKHRLNDVYVGVDVFGRGCRGGGGYNTREAIQGAIDFDLSVAIFGQGWVYETQDKTKFTENENRFWSLFDDLCAVQETVVDMENDVLVSTFCRGRGHRLFHQGQAVSDAPWSNLSVQSLQPSFTSAQFVKDKREQEMSHYLDDGFQGGGCLSLKGNFTTTSLTYRLFKTDIAVPPEFEVYFAHKSLSAGYEVTIKLTFQKSRGETTENISYYCGNNDISESVFKMRPSETEERSRYFQATETMDLNDWCASKASCFLGQSGFRLREVAAEVFRKDKSAAVSCSVLLGAIQIKPKPSTVEEVLLLSNIQQSRIPAGAPQPVGATGETTNNQSEGGTDNGNTDGSTDNTDVSVTTSQTNEKNSPAQKFSTLVTWTYPETHSKRLFYVYAHYPDKSRRMLIGQTRSHHYVVPHSLLDQLAPPVHLEVLPVTYNPWQTVAGPYRILIKDAARS